MKIYVFLLAIAISTLLLCSVGHAEYAQDNINSGPELTPVVNYNFWYSYFIDTKSILRDSINGIEGMNDHGHTYELKTGEILSIYAGYTPDFDITKAKEPTNNCEARQGIGIFEKIYICDDEIVCKAVSDVPHFNQFEYVITYRSKDPKSYNPNIFDQFSLVLKTFRTIRGEEFAALYKAMYVK